MWSPKAGHRFTYLGLRSVVAVMAVLTMTASLLTATARPARAAADNGVSDLLGVLGSGGDPTHNLAAWTSGLGGIGKLGEQLPLVSASPGGLLGFADLFQKAVTDKLTGANTFGDLAKDTDIDIGNGRTGHLSTTVSDEGDGKRLAIVVTANRTVTGQGLHLASGSPKVDLTISDGITVQLKSRLALSLVWTGATDDKVYVVADDASPRLDVDGYASIDATAAKASVGILGVSLADSALNLSAHFVGKVNDPDNDGKLYFTQTAAGDGELSQDGSLAGLVSIGLDPEGSLPIDNTDSNSRGSISDTTFKLGATAAAEGLSLPGGITATIGVSWPDIGTGTPTITAPDLADTAIGKFQNMSLKDLAEGLAQVVVGITAIQKAKFGSPATGDLDLPFMRGKLSDAIQVGQKLKDFLAANVDQGTSDPSKIGQPNFTSLQDLLKRLKETTGITLSNLDWDSATSKLNLTLGLEQAAPASAIDLDKVSAEASGSTATYGAKTLTVSGANWKTDQWLGRRVIAGTSAGEVAGNTADTITLKQDWVGGTPLPNTPYVITGAEPHVGAVSFADRVQSGGAGIVNANADQTFAKVTPSYKTTVTLVLDLQAPKTGDACIGFEGNTQACPFTKTDGPLQTQVESLPLNTDRVMIRTGSSLFDADLPIDTKVDLTANAGFFKVRLEGTLKACNSSKADTCPDGSATGHMLTVGLKNLGDLRMSQLFAKLVADPASLLDVDVNIRAYADVTVSLPDAANFLPPGTTAKFTAKWTNLTDPSTLSLDTSKLSEIFKLDFDTNDPKALFTLLIKTLQTLSAQLASANTAKGSGVFNKPIPGLGRSLRELLASDEANGGDKVSYGPNTLKDDSRSSTDHPFTDKLVGRTVVVGTQIGVIQSVSGDGKTLTLAKNWSTQPAPGTPYRMRSALDDATDHLLATPPDNIQDAVKVLNDALGTDSVKFRYLDTGGTGNLVLDVDWQRGYRVASPIKLALGNVSGSDRTFAGAEATGMAQVTMNGRIKVGLVIPLVAGPGPADGNALKVLEDSSISVGAKPEFDGVVKGVIGPLSIALGKPGGTDNAKAKADLTLGLAKPNAAADTPVSFSTFIGAVDVAFNAASGKVDCGEGLTTELMVCARLPMYLNNSGASNGWTSIGEIDLRLPKSTDPAKLFDFSGNLPAPDDTKPKLQLPTDLGDQLAKAILDFGNLGDGLEAWLARVEQAFQLASLQGKLPLIGEDLQKGADFIGTLRTKLRDSIWNQLPGAGRPATAEEFKKFIDDHLAAALAEANIAATATVDFNCTETLHPVSGPVTVTPTQNPPPTTDPPTPVPPTGTWQYQIVAYQGSSADKSGDTKPSAVGSATNYQNLEFGSYNDVQWNPVDHASGYKVLRKGPNDTEFKQIGTSTGTTFHDTVPTGGTAYGAFVTEEPKLNPCPLEFIDGVSLTFTAQRGKVSTDKGCEDTGAPKPCIPKDIPLDIGIPGLSLRQGADGTNGIHLALGYEIHFKLGLNKQDGFYLATKPGDNSVAVGLNFDLPKQMIAELAFIKINVNKATGTGHDPSKPLFAGAFQIGLKSVSGDKLPLADIGSTSLSNLVGVSLTGTFHLDWILQAEVDSALPGVRANFQLDWGFNNQAPDAFGAPTIAFKDVGITAGSFFQGVLGDAVKLMKKVTGPIQPVIDTLYAPIPVLSDLSRLAGGDDVTLITLAKAFNTLPTEPALNFVDTVKAVIEFINRLPSCDETSKDCFVPIGSFELSGDKALATSNSPTTADKLYADNGVHAQTGDEVKTALNGKNDNPAAAGHSVFGVGGGGPGQAQAQAEAEGDAEKSGFTFPILDQPAKVFDLIMGSDVTLVEFDSGSLTIGFSWRQDFGPVYAPPPVLVTLAGSASASLRVVAGLDTYGLRKAVEAVRNGTKLDGVKVLDGLFLKTVDTNGNPIPVVTLTGEIAAGAAVSAVIIKVGVDGGLRLTIAFYWNDPDHDGKFRVTEFGQVAMNNPLCLFTMRGKLSLFLRVYITIGIGPFSTSFSFTLADVTLLDFTVEPDCAPPPPRLGGTVGDTLVVYAGNLGGEDYRGKGWGNTGDNYVETVKAIALHYAQKPDDLAGTNPDFDGFAIEMLGERREYLDPNLKRVVVDGTGYDKPMVVTFIGDGKKTTDDTAGKDPTAFDKDAVVIGGNKDDVISTGTGLSYVYGRPGNDKIVTHDTGGAASKAWVAGGAGDATITVGNGDDQVAGDGNLGSATQTVDLTPNDEDGGAKNKKTNVTVVDWANLKNPTTTTNCPQAQDPSNCPDDGSDTINVGLGVNTVRGNGGGDRISVASDAPDGSKTAGKNTLIGDAGSDTIVGGSNEDKIFTAGASEFGVDEAGPPDAAATSDKPNIVFTGTGDDKVWGSAGVDLVNSQSTTAQKAVIRGGAGNDVLVGGFGTDEIYGGPADDYVIAEPAEVGPESGTDMINNLSYGPHRSVTKLALPATVAPSTKVLVGGTGNDHVIGGDGATTAFGDRYITAEKCAAGDPVPSDPVAESTNATNGDGNDLITGGAATDTISAGGADDIAYGQGGDDLLCGQQGNDVLYGGDGTDKAWGGGDDDLIYGDAGADFLFGNLGNDTGFGGAGNDTIEGNDDSDWLSGGLGDDIGYGGTRAAGRDDTDQLGPNGNPKGDDLYGDAGNDILIGDNGTVTDPYPYDLDGTKPTAGAGDRIHGGAGQDLLYGGLGDDVINGNDADDYIEGNNGSDTIHGNAGEDVITGGSSQQASAGIGRPDTGDTIFGDDGPDLIAADNAIISVTSDPAQAARVTRYRQYAKSYPVQLLDLGENPNVNNSGNDYVDGGSSADVVFGQGAHDRLKGGADDDYVEGGPGIDWIEGDQGNDDLVGGSSTPFSGSGEDTRGQPDTDDGIFGGQGDDVILGDNGVILRPGPGEASTRSTVRMSTAPGVQMTGRIIQMYDRRNSGSYLTPPTANRYGSDRIAGGEGVDVSYGQDGKDYVSGGAHDDYIEGNNGADVIRGDLSLGGSSTQTTVAPLADPGWRGASSGQALLEGAAGPDGQDDIIGGSSTAGFRDGDDVMEGNGGDDYQLGDNGSLMRTIQTVNGVAQEKVYQERYPAGAVPATATRSRIADPDKGPSTRFCTTAQATCEPIGAYGNDTMYGDDGDDTMYGQDGGDIMSGANGNDVMYGELGDDTMSGGNGDDAMVGDRGGVTQKYLNPGDSPAPLTITNNQVPQETFTGFRTGTVHSFVDLRHDVDGNQFTGSATSPPMPHAGLTEGGKDSMRGGAGNDNVHGAFVDDLINGDSGGDVVFGDDGVDVLWGGKGCDPVLNAATPDCLGVGGTFDPTSRGTNDRFVDHIFGGQGGDIVDWDPRGSYPNNCAPGTAPVTTGGGKNQVTVDPCSWFVMTNKNDADPANNQHHQGTDWIYGGWDADVMQADVAGNGPNPGDRLIDWTGAYNLYSHCPAAYGGYNDIRLMAPDLFTFLTGLAWIDGAGQTSSDVTTSGTSAFRELAFTYTEDINAHGSGAAYPSTPGHFDDPQACSE
jgi:Ca2+-binding RTX toxin-like protein